MVVNNQPVTLDANYTPSTEKKSPPPGLEVTSNNSHLFMIDGINPSIEHRPTNKPVTEPANVVL